jgi:hypothetical protein
MHPQYAFILAKRVYVYVVASTGCSIAALTLALGFWLPVDFGQIYNFLEELKHIEEEAMLFFDGYVLASFFKQFGDAILLHWFCYHRCDRG